MDLKLMEHHEHHFPTYESRFNCLISPPQGYKVSRLSFLSFFSPSPHLNLIMSLSYKVAGVGSYTHHMNIYLQAEPLNLVIIHYVVKMSSACRFRFDLATRKWLEFCAYDINWAVKICGHFTIKWTLAYETTSAPSLQWLYNCLSTQGSVWWYGTN